MLGIEHQAFNSYQVHVPELMQLNHTDHEGKQHVHVEPA
jgi:hypothetical protein